MQKGKMSKTFKYTSLAFYSIFCSGLFQSNNADIPSTGVVVTPVYLWVGEEQDSPQASQHELNLTKQYKVLITFPAQE